MSVHDAVCLTYQDAAILACGIVLSWIAFYVWGTCSNGDR